MASPSLGEVETAGERQPVCPLVTSKEPIQTVQKPFQCGLCTISFSINILLVDHVHKHSLTKPFQCGFCKVSYDTNPELIMHIETHVCFGMGVDLGDVKQESQYSAEGEICFISASIESTETAETFVQKHEVVDAIHMTAKDGMDEEDTHCGDSLEELVEKVVEPGSDSLEHRKSECTSRDSAGDNSTASTEILAAQVITHLRSESDMPGSSNRHEPDCISSVKEPGKAVQLGFLAVSVLSGQSRPTVEEILSAAHVTVDTLTSCHDKENSTPKTVMENNCAQKEDGKFTRRDVVELSLSCHNTDNTTNRQSETLVESNPPQTDGLESVAVNSDVKSSDNSTKSYSCDICGASFRLARYLTDHRRRVHKISAKAKLTNVDLSSDKTTSQTQKPEVNREGACHAEVSKALSCQTQSQSQCEETDSERKFCCTQCTCRYKTKSNLSSHIRRVHRAKTYQCTECSATFKRENSLRYHRQYVHTDQRPFSCTHCPARFKAKNHLKTHLKTVHSSERPFGCHVCSAHFKRRDGLFDHLFDVHKIDILLPCKYCDIGLKSKQLMQERMDKSVQCPHFKRRLTLKPSAPLHVLQIRAELFKCDHCPVQFLESKALSDHMKSNHSRCSLGDEVGSLSKSDHSELEKLGKKAKSSSATEHTESNHISSDLDKDVKSLPMIGPIESDILSDSYKDRSVSEDTNLTESEHISVTPDTRNYACSQCNLQCQSQLQLSRHVSDMHTNQKRYSCSECPAGFHLKSRLAAHTLEVHCKQFFSCSCCPSHFKTSAQLRQHKMKVHSPYLCTGCGKSFQARKLLNIHWCKPKDCHVCGSYCSTASSFIEHMRKHSIHQCKLCGRGFMQKKSLDYHIRLHKQEKPFTCEYCGKSFVDRRILSYHTNTHTGAKPFQCKLCQKPFHSFPVMWRHQHQCRGEKNTKCNVCGMKFYHSVFMRKHSLTHTDQKKFTCQICSKAYKSRTGLKNHVRKFHKVSS